MNRSTLTSTSARLVTVTEYAAWTTSTKLKQAWERVQHDSDIAIEVVFSARETLRRDVPDFSKRLWLEAIRPQSHLAITTFYERDFDARYGRIMNFIIPHLPALTVLFFQAIKLLVIVSLLTWQLCMAVYKKGESMVQAILDQVRVGGRMAERALIGSAVLAFGAAGLVTVRWFQSEIAGPETWGKMEVAFEKVEDDMLPDAHSAGRSAMLDTKKHGWVRVTLHAPKAD